jgi:capsular exopolysaccharide synthesis family protein
MLRSSLAAARDESDKLNATSFRYTQLEHEVQSKTALYNDLNRKIEEESINAGLQSSSIRIADEALPPLHPVFPRKSIFAFLGFLISFLISSALVILADLLNNNIRDTVGVSNVAGIRVVGTLPDVRRFPLHLFSSDLQDTLSIDKRTQTTAHGFYQECVASSLSTALSSRWNAQMRSILITSPGPAEGKSCFAAHFAAARAAQGKKTLLVDADLRCPSQHKYLQVTRNAGLAGMIADNLRLHDVRQPVPGMDNLDVIVAGTTQNAPLAGVGQKILQLITEARKEYSLIVIDAPPMLSFAEPIQIASGVDGVLLIGRAGYTSRQSLLHSISTLRAVGANVVGMLLNRVPLNEHDDYMRYRAYSSYSQKQIASISS